MAPVKILVDRQVRARGGRRPGRGQDPAQLRGQPLRGRGGQARGLHPGAVARRRAPQVHRRGRHHEHHGADRRRGHHAAARPAPSCPASRATRCSPLLRKWGLKVSERQISIDEVVAARTSGGTLKEVWGTGTAAVISPVGELAYKGERMVINGGTIGAAHPEALRRHRGHPVRHGARPARLDASRSEASRDERLRLLQDPRRPDPVDEDLRGRPHAHVHGHQPAQLRPLPGDHQAHAADHLRGRRPRISQAAMATAKRVAPPSADALKPDGLNVLQANGAAAFQSVPHFHLHLIPRWTQRRQGLRLEAGAGRPRPDHEDRASGSAPRSRARRAMSRAHGPRGGRQAGARRPRPRRQDRGAGAAGRRLRGDLHRPAPDARADRRHRRPGGRRRHRALRALRAPTTISSSACSSCCASKGADDIAVFGGGIIPRRGHRGLKALGVKELFTPGTSTQDIIRFVRENIRRRRSSAGLDGLRADRRAAGRCGDARAGVRP